jgi:hypothetical protein
VKLKAIVNTIEEVEEPFRPLYVEEQKDGRATGRFKLDAEGVEFAEDVKGLKSALDNVRAERDEAKKAAAKLKDVNPEEYQRLLRENEQRIEREQAVQREAATKIEEAERAHAAEVAKLNAAITKLRASYHELFVETQATGAIIDEKGVPQLLMPHLRSRIRVKEERDGSLKLEVLKADGQPMLSDKGEPGAPIDLVKELKLSDTFGRCFDGGGQGGAGAGNNRGGHNGAPPRNPWKKDSLNLTEQSRIYKENPALAATLRQEAGATT